MRPRSPIRIAAISTLVALVALAGSSCGRDSGTLQPAPPNDDPLVFGDDYGSYCTFQAFLGSKVDAVVVDTAEKYKGTASLRVTIPGPGDPSGSYAGGAFTTSLARQLSGYDALTFWAKSSLPDTVRLNVAGLGNDNTGTSKYEAEWDAIPVTGNWMKYIIPIPFPEKLISEQGLFFFAEGPENNMGYQLWLDEIRFENLGAISNPRPSMSTRTVGTFVGANVNIEGTQTIFDVSGSDETIQHSSGYFTFTSSADSVATVVDGVIRMVGGGSATITGRLGTVDATGSVTVIASSPPTTAPPTPTVPAGDVISLFSNAYINVPVDTWSADWPDQADVADGRFAGNDVKVYTNLVYAGIEFASPTIDATAMTHFHLDVWVPAGTTFKVKLVDFGANGVYDPPGSPGRDDREHELTFNASSTPPLVTGSWVSLEMPLANFVNLTTRAHLAQLILSGDTRTAYVDNVYFHK